MPSLSAFRQFAMEAPHRTALTSHEHDLGLRSQTNNVYLPARVLTRSLPAQRQYRFAHLKCLGRSLSLGVSWPSQKQSTPSSLSSPLVTAQPKMTTSATSSRHRSGVRRIFSGAVSPSYFSAPGASSICPSLIPVEPQQSDTRSTATRKGGIKNVILNRFGVDLL